MADGFLGRWSRRKQDVRAGKELEEPARPAPVVPAPAPVAAGGAFVQAEGLTPPEAAAAPSAPEKLPVPSLEDAQALTPQSDFVPFVDRAVPPEVRNLAFKKLFTDPHFNVMDGLDIYVGDYTQPDPLPAGMLRKMASAHAMGFFADEKKTATDPQAGPVVSEDHLYCGNKDTNSSYSALESRGDAEGCSGADVAQLDVCNAVPSVPSSEPDGLAQLPDTAAGPPSASQLTHDHADLRLQPDDAPQRQGVGRGAA